MIFYIVYKQELTTNIKAELWFCYCMMLVAVFDNKSAPHHAFKLTIVVTVFDEAAHCSSCYCGGLCYCHNV